MNAPVEFLTTWPAKDIPAQVLRQVKLSLLDSLGIAMGGRLTPLSDIIYTFAGDVFPGTLALPWSTKSTNAVGYALALATTTDALDGHDGFNMAKGHIGCPVYPALLAATQDQALCPQIPRADQFLDALAVGYEIGARASMAQHGTVADFHTSGSWGAVAGAAAIGRMIGLDATRLRHAMGIAEYHGPRSQMMRCLDYPTMLKDGSGIGAMTAVMSIKLALLGYTGAPAVIIEDAPTYWADLGTRWYGLEQYYKPFAVCRYAHAPVEAVLELKTRHGIRAAEIKRVTIETFHESLRLATKHPTTTEEAQYSTAFPVALALEFGEIQPWHLLNQTIKDKAVHALSDRIEIIESDMANAAFPAKRFAKVTIETNDSAILQSSWHTPRWDAVDPPEPAELIDKYRQISIPLVGANHSQEIETAVLELDQAQGSLPALLAAMSRSKIASTAAANSS